MPRPAAGSRLPLCPPACPSYARACFFVFITFPGFFFNQQLFLSMRATLIGEKGSIRELRKTEIEFTVSGREITRALNCGMVEQPVYSPMIFPSTPTVCSLFWFTELLIITKCIDQDGKKANNWSCAMIVCGRVDFANLSSVSTSTCSTFEQMSYLYFDHSSPNSKQSVQTKKRKHVMKATLPYHYSSFNLSGTSLSVLQL